MKKSPIILGLQYGGHDTSAALMVDGEIVAACEQERYTLDKHSRLFPNTAINDCLKIGHITIDDVDEISFAFDPFYWIRETYLKTAIESKDRIGFLINDIERIKEHYIFEELVRQKTGFKKNIEFQLHHICHLASAYYPSGFDEALLISLDGAGEIETGLIAEGKNGNINILRSGNRYPDSLGLLYSAITHYLGYKHHCDEGIIMGLAAFGDPFEKIPEQKQ